MKKRKYGSASNFIRKNPDIPAKDLVEIAKKSGLTFSVSLVNTVRAADAKKAAAQKPAKHVVRRVKPVATSNGKVSILNSELSDSDRQFVGLVIKLGLIRANQLLDGISNV